jgi:uncharacterized protein YvpB
MIWRNKALKVLILGSVSVAICGLTLMKLSPVEAAEVTPIDMVIEEKAPPLDLGEGKMPQMREILMEDTSSVSQSETQESIEGQTQENAIPIDIPPVVDTQNSKSDISNSAQEVTSTIPEPIIHLPMADDYHSQKTETYLPNACGPTSLLMVLDHYEIESSLERVIEELDIPPQEGGYDPSCSANAICMSPGAIERTAREHYDLRVDAHDEWSFQDVQEALAKGSPIIADIAWRGKMQGPGHFVVIYGIDMEKEEIFYHDPYDGPEMIAKFADFEASWKGPIDAGDPLRPQGHNFWGMAILPE